MWSYLGWVVANECAVCYADKRNPQGQVNQANLKIDVYLMEYSYPCKTLDLRCAFSV